MRDMTEFEINNKHEQIRGSNEMKYPPNESRCRQTCGHKHDEYIDREGHQRSKEHRCFLAIGHPQKYCQFSSECFERRVRAVTLNVEGAAA